MNLTPMAVALATLTCGALVAYSYVGYPVLIWGLARIFGRSDEPSGIVERDPPTVSLLIAAHNEEEVIEGRLRNALAMDYPAGKLQVAVASDGSTDGTAPLVRRFAGRGVLLLEFPTRRGKAAVLNAAVPELTGEILLLTDANTMIEPAAVRRLARWFHDPEVGVVCGRLVLTDPETGANADGLYWKYETFLKRCEARLGALLGANGAIYAIRKELYTPIPDGTIVDDLVIPLLARLRTGCKLVYDAEAIAREETAPDVEAEFRRRVRIGAGGFQSLALIGGLLDPRRGWVAFAFISHKVLRWFGPFFLIGLFVGSYGLRTWPVFRTLLLVQAAFYLASALSSVLPSRVASWKPLKLATLFTSMNAALLVGFERWLLGKQKGIWERTARPRTDPANAPVPSTGFAKALIGPRVRLLENRPAEPRRPLPPIKRSRGL